MELYESKLFAVLVGAAIAFLSSWGLFHVEKLRKQRAIHSALKSEISYLNKYFKARLEVYRKMILTKAQGGKISIYPTDRRLDTVFSTSISNISFIKTNLIESVVIFYVLVNEFKSRVDGLSLAIDDLNKNTESLVDHEFVQSSLQRIVRTLEQAVDDSEALIGRL